ncbi:MAG: hypothetical protein Kow0037_10260 [Calditrichia bacterium]
MEKRIKPAVLLSFMKEVILQSRLLADERNSATPRQQKQLLERIWFNMDLIHNIPDLLLAESKLDEEFFLEMLASYDQIWPKYLGKSLTETFKQCLKEYSD